MDLHTMSRRELQDLAKKYKIRANLKTLELITELEKTLGKSNVEVETANENSKLESNVLEKSMEKLNLNREERHRGDNTRSGAGPQSKTSPGKVKDNAESPLMAIMRRAKEAQSQNGSVLKTPSRIPNRRSTIGPSELWTPVQGENIKNITESNRSVVDQPTSSIRRANNLSLPDDIVDERIRIAVNAIRALRVGEKGCTFEQVCDFIKLNSSGYYSPGQTAVQLHRTLRMAVEKQVVIGKESDDREIRFSVPDSALDSPILKRGVATNGKDSSHPLQKTETIAKSPDSASRRKTISGVEQFFTLQSQPLIKTGGNANRALAEPTASNPQYTAVSQKKVEFKSSERNRKDMNESSSELRRHILSAVKQERLRRNRFRIHSLKEATVDASLQRTQDYLDAVKPTLLPAYTCSMCCKEKESPAPQSSTSIEQPFFTPVVPRTRAKITAATPYEERPGGNGTSNEVSRSEIVIEEETQVGGMVEELPENWIFRESRSKPGRWYYYNTVTKETTWTLPKA